jgi:malonyl CoA-acyl carrier protein transacylase
VEAKMTTYVFPGQGSQCIGMGENLFDEFAELATTASNILGYSIKSLCLEGPAEKLNQTQYTQPAMYLVNALHYYKKLSNSHQKPQYVAGHSLGEYNALLAAEVFDFETGLKLVQKRGELMSKAKGGSMAAVIGLSVDEIRTILNENNFTNIIMANFNSPIQTIISGPASDITRAQSIFEKKSLFKILNVSGAFHSPYMLAAQLEFTSFMDQFSFSSPKITVIANVDAQPYQTTDVKNKLSNQLTQPVQWQKSIEFLLTNGENNFEEIGTGNVLTSLINNIKMKYQSTLATS